MRIYPAIKAQMGDWSYYIVRMKMREVAQEVQLAHDIYTDNTLSEAIQRELRATRVKREIVGYLARRPDRFFSSIVVAATNGEPTWHPVEMDPDVVPSIFAESRTLRESFGVLSFGDDPKYYALDGQHRVAAIKLLESGEAEFRPPAGFEDDLLSVIVVLREEHDVPEGEWMRRYRRLFSSLNRYARPTDKDTNIIMDEDDMFAILTRRIITDHEFFQAPGREKESFKVQTKGKNLARGSNHFTTLQTLYAMNEILLRTRRRESGWFEDGGGIDKQIRPEEDFIDDCYLELSDYWDAILAALPALCNKPVAMRQHSLQEDGEEQDHLMFWPIGQELLGQIIRDLLDDQCTDGYSDVEDMTETLYPLSQISFELHDPPWRWLLLVATASGSSWRIRSEDRKDALRVAGRIIRWMLDLDTLDEDEAQELRDDWAALLYYDEDEDDEDDMWTTVEETRSRVTESRTED